MLNWFIDTENNKLVFECGCKFNIAKMLGDKMPRISIDYENLPDCRGVWDMIGQGKVKGVFQLESQFGKQWAQDVKPESLEHMSALGSILRPGALQAIDKDGISTTKHYSLRKNGLEPVPKVNPVIDEILQDTYGLSIYQEQSIELAVKLAAFTPAKADLLRRCVDIDTVFLSKTRGWISIKKLLVDGYVNDIFLVMDENGKQYWKPIKEIWKTGTLSTAKITTNTGFSINTTKYHQFLTDSGWKARCRLNNNDFLISSSLMDFDGNDKISDDYAIVIAGLITEGYFKNNRGSHFTNFCQETMTIFMNSYKSVFSKYPRLYGNVARINTKEFKEIATILTPGLSKDKFIPECMMSSTKNQCRKFLSYMFNAEGSFETNKIEFSSASEKLIDQIKLLLLRFNIISYKNKKFNKKYSRNYFVLIITDRNSIASFKNELNCLLNTTKLTALNNIDISETSGGGSKNRIPKTIFKKYLNQYPQFVGDKSGSIYNNHLSKIKAIKLSKLSNDNYWIDKFSSSIYYDKLELIKNNKKVDVYDFTIDDETPFIIANGLVIHNSIGKKDTQLMKKVEKEFIDGCKTKNIISEALAIQIFDDIKKSQRYQFNHSHSYQYSIVGYKTAYAKYHFPVNFFTAYVAWAKEKMDAEQEMNDLVMDAKLFDIDVLPPQLETLKADPYNDGKNVFLGLTDIKGVGGKTLTAIKENIKENNLNVSDMTIDEIIIYSQLFIGVGVLEKIINAGGLRKWTKDRKPLVDKLLKFDMLTKGEKAWCLEYIKNNKTATFIDVLSNCAKKKSEGGGCHTEAKAETVKKILESIKNPPSPLDDTPFYVYNSELNAFGVPLTISKVDTVNAVDVSQTCRDFIESKDKEYILNVAIVDYREIIVKRGKSAGKAMCYMSLTDGTAKLDSCTLFAEQYEEFKRFIDVGAVIVVKGYKDTKKGSPSLIVEKIFKGEK